MSNKPKGTDALHAKIVDAYRNFKPTGETRRLVDDAYFKSDAGAETKHTVSRLMMAVEDIRPWLKHDMDEPCSSCIRFDELLGAAVEALARIAELEAENQRLQTENEILLREKVRWILGGGE